MFQIEKPRRCKIIFSYEYGNGVFSQEMVTTILANSIVGGVHKLISQYERLDYRVTNIKPNYECLLYPVISSHDQSSEIRVSQEGSRTVTVTTEDHSVSIHVGRKFVSFDVKRCNLAA